jgi:hypothetical protein
MAKKAKRPTPIKGKARARKATSAKKPAAKKAAPKKAAPRAAKPKQQRLLDDMPRVRALDRLCEGLADVRERRNNDNAEEKALLQSALRELVKHNTPIYKAHGVELVHVKGDDKIRMRLVDDDNDTDELGDERREDVETVDEEVEGHAGENEAGDEQTE